MKKILIKFIILITSIFIFCNNVFAYTSTLSPSKTTVNPGNTFTIKINLSGITNGLGSAEYTLGFDNSLFEVTKINTTASHNTLSSSIKLTFVDLTGINPKQNGTFATITFKAKNITTDKTGTFTLTSKETSDSTGKSISSSNKGTSVKIHIPDTDNTLKNLTINGSTVSGFSSNTLNYTYKTESSSIKIGATSNSSMAKISGTGTKSVDYGTNTYSIVVTAENGSKKTYKITVTRPDNRETINTLESLSIDGYTISPEFNKNTTSYTLNVENDIEKVKINATKTSTKSSFVSGYDPREVNLEYGKNTIYVKVKAENEKINTYTITIYREDNRSTVNTLKSLTPSIGQIKFEEDVLEYSIVTDQNEISITAETQDTKATVTGNTTYQLKTGLNELKVVVTAENQTTKTYIIKVIKVDDISSLNISNSLKELNILKKYQIEFNKNKTEYNVTIGDETSLELDYKLDDDYSTVEVLGNENLKDGSVITIKLTSIDGSTKEYKINIKKQTMEEKPVEENNGNLLIITLLVISVLLNLILLLTKNKKKVEKKKELKEKKKEEPKKEKKEVIEEETPLEEIPEEVIVIEEEKDNK